MSGTRPERRGSAEPTLFHADEDGRPRPSSSPPEPDPSRTRRARGSALWAAYGDALGFISELTDEAGLRRRTGGEELRVPIPWRRRIGGRSGTMALLPAGCYSDDTQLRIATARAIGPRGFDVEAFAKVELPVWAAYALGGGLASKKAAANLAKPTVSWFANAYGGWTESGGNGAAMRIQPHVWSAVSLEDPSSYVLDVLRNAVCTHGHSVALLGAVLHALSLAYATSTGSVPSGEMLIDLIGKASVVPSLVRADPELSDLWLGNWERASRRSFDQAWEKALVDGREAAMAAEGAVSEGGPEGYGVLVKELGLLDPARRGSGLLTAIASVALLWCEPRPAEALRIAANVIGSDTDTIATMAGAIVGATSDIDPPVEVLDAQLIVSEAERMAAIADGASGAGHTYPDLLSWSAPRTQADALVSGSDGLHVVGLGRVSRTLGEPMLANQGEFSWQWARLALGQTVLIKRRNELPTAQARDLKPPVTRSRMTGKELGLSLAVRAPQYAWFVGAGASAAANVPTGGDMIIDFKARLFCAEVGVPRREIDPADPMWLERIEAHLDGKGGLPPNGHPHEYAALFEAVFPEESERRSYIERALKQSRASFGHRLLAALISSGQVPCLFTTNFDQLIERSTVVADELLPVDRRTSLTVAAIDSPDRAVRCLSDSSWPLLVKLHGDYQSVLLKNTTAELQAQDAALRQVLVGACNRFGLIVVGYSGRDDSVMTALHDALAGPSPFPAGVRWVVRSGSTPLPAVVSFLDAAEAAGVDAKFVESETFDELAADIDRQATFPAELAEHVRDARPDPVVQPVTLPTVERSAFPVLRCSALPLLALPTVARRVTLSRPTTWPEARAALKAAKLSGIIAVRGAELLAFGADEDLLAAFGALGAKIDGHVALSPDSDSLHHGLLYDALMRALTRGRPLRPILRRGGHAIIVSAPNPSRSPEQRQADRERLAPLQAAYSDSLTGTVPGARLPFAEAIKIRLERYDEKWWCVFDPFTWVDFPRAGPVADGAAEWPSTSSRRDQSDPTGDWRKERWTRRYNPKWSGILDAWAGLLVSGQQDSPEAIGLRGRPGVDAQYTISGTTAWSRPA